MYFVVIFLLHKREREREKNKGLVIQCCQTIYFFEWRVGSFFFLSVDELFEFVLLKIKKSRFSAVDEFKQKPLLFPTIAAQNNGLIIHMVPSI
jgi:hypothetical protein